MMTLNWIIARQSRCCFTCGANVQGHACVRLTATRMRADALAITQVCLCRDCFVSLAQATGASAYPCDDLKRAA